MVLCQLVPPAVLNQVDEDRLVRMTAKRCDATRTAVTNMLKEAKSAYRAEHSGERGPGFSADEIAYAFADEHGANLRYVAAWGHWFRWTGAVWERDDILHIWYLARQICSEAAQRWPVAAEDLRSARTVAAVVTLARCDPRIAATVGQWDADDWALNTPAGIVHLRTGRMRAHRAEDYCTKITSVSPDRQCPTELFFSFLDRITAENYELQAYQQRYFGYCLTGVTIEHMLAFGFGTGRNGKDSLVSVIIGILGAYHEAAAMETFIASNVEHHATAEAGLQGARLVTASETEEGRRWAEVKIKEMTGGGIMKARFMRQDYFPSSRFSLLATTNRACDQSMRQSGHGSIFGRSVCSSRRRKGTRSWAISSRMNGRGFWPG
jgi:putative DNA primase/helicase